MLSACGLIALATLVYSFYTSDSTPLTTLIDGTMKLCAIAVGFYYWKAKCENIQKYKNTDKIGEINDEK